MDVKTRWNSTFYMLKRLVLVHKELNATLVAANRTAECITPAQLATIKSMLELLAHFERVTVRVSSER